MPEQEPKNTAPQMHIPTPLVRLEKVVTDMHQFEKNLIRSFEQSVYDNMASYPAIDRQNDAEWQQLLDKATPVMQRHAQTYNTMYEDYLDLMKQATKGFNGSDDDREIYAHRANVMKQELQQNIGVQLIGLRTLSELKVGETVSEAAKDLSSRIAELARVAIPDCEKALSKLNYTHQLQGKDMRPVMGPYTHERVKMPDDQKELSIIGLS